MKIILSFLLFFASITISNAQFFNGVGLLVGVAAEDQKFIFNSPRSVSKKDFAIGFNASLFLELLNNDYVRIITEGMYNEKGSKDKDAGTRHKLNYASWNNYLKFRQEMYLIIPYVLVGVRAEYLVSQSTPSPFITSNFSGFHASPAAGVGVEFVSYGNLKFLTHFIYNPDIGLPSYVDSRLKVNNTNYEIQLGLKYQFQSRVGACNVPVP